MRRITLAILLAVVGVLALSHSSVRAQQPQNPAVMQGVLTAVWGDPQGTDPAPGIPRLALHLTDAQGTTTPIQVTESVLQAAGGLRALDRHEVVITTASIQTALANAGAPIAVQSIRLAATNELMSAMSATAAEPLTGSQPRALLLCRFADSTGVTPHPPSFYTGLMGSTSPGLNHYWQETSYNNINLNGTVVYGWYNLPQPRSYYVGTTANLNLLADDCMAAADPFVFFPNFTGVDLNFNDDLDCCAWGGGRTVTIDGQTRFYAMTWMPPWAQISAVYAHETGHSFGFPHSSGPYAATYDSKWDPMSDPYHGTVDPAYGYVPTHTIMHHKNLDAWIPAARRFDTPPNTLTTITLTRSAFPDSGGYLFAKIPIAGSASKFYTVELRRFAGYDMNLPGEAVVIHNVDTMRSDRDAQVVDATNDNNPNDAGAMWMPGETFTDAPNGITVSVLSMTSTTASVSIQLGTATQTENDSDGDGKADLTIFRPSNGTWLIRNSASGYTTTTTYQFGTATDLPAAGDYDGDGRMDPAFYRPSTGGWHIRQSSNGSTVVRLLGMASDLPVPGDYDGDGKIDPAVYRPSTRAWFILASSLGYGTALTYQWGQAGDVPVAGDFDGDSKTDLTVYRPSTGRWLELTSASGFTVSREFQFGLSGDVPVPGDYDEDGTTDVAVYRPNTGVWFILRSSTNFATSVSHQWGLSGDMPVPGDYDGDGTTDLAVYRTSNGTWYIAQSTTNYATSATFQFGLNGDVPGPLSTLAHALAVRSTLVTLVRGSNFDTDRKSDLTVYRPSSGTWFALRSSTNFTSFASYQWGSTNDIPVPHDYDGDGRTDVAYYRTASGHWSILQSSSNYTTSVLRQWGAAGDLPVAGEFDGDGRADPAIYRPSNGMWHIVQSSTNFTSSLVFQWGLNGDVPVAADYDGDSVSDIAVYRPSSGEWFIRYSSTGFATTVSYQWGLSGDIAVPGEYDGDGKTDLAVYRPSSGHWFIRYSSTGYGSSTAYQWGLSSDIPVPGDFDGDAKTDLAVWRPASGTWYLLKSSTNFTSSTIIQWGLSGDIPILRRP